MMNNYPHQANMDFAAIVRNWFLPSYQTGEPLVDRLRKEIEDTRPCLSESSTKNNVTAVNSFERFINETMKGKSSLSIQNVTSDHIRAFERWLLNSGKKPGYVSEQMRCLRSLINRFSDRGRELFKKVRTSVTPSEKRAENEKCFRKLWGIRNSLKKRDGLYCRISLFCFYGMGIPLIDALFLKKSQLKDGVITYYRHKTHRKITIEIGEELATLLEELMDDDSIYLIPVLTEKDPKKAMREYKRFYQKYMRGLKRISASLGENVHLTSYTPRHSWASIAYKNGVDINVISRALGHSNPNVTLIYIREIEDCQLHEASRIVCRAIR
ncbi:MAG: tyrosine-type recombinase/integrase [Prevotella sp.]|nr:tyrosine-type recombinase/integrase [Prevotella sp.]